MKTMRRLFACILILALLLSSLSAIAEATLRLPDALKVIEEEAFYGATSIDQVVVPEGTTEIRARAFANSSLSAINLPDSLTFIDDTALAGLADLTVAANAGTYAYDWAAEHMYLPDCFSIADIHVEYGEIDVRDGRVYWEYVPGFECESEITGINATGEWTMTSSDAWISISMQESGNYQAELSENRTGKSRTGAIRVACGDAVKTITVVQDPYLEAKMISPSALAQDGLADIYYDETLGKYVAPAGGNYPVLAFEDLEMTFEIPDGVESYYTFEVCTSIEGAIWDGDASEQFTEIIPREYFEAGSGELNYIIITLEDELWNYETSYAFYISDEGLDGLRVKCVPDPDSGETIGLGVTDYNGDATDLVIPDTLLGDPVVYIESDTLTENDQITSVVIPNTVKEIGSGAFRDCANLTSVTVPEGVQEIREGAFANCPNLKQFNAVEGSYAYTWGVKNGFIAADTVTENDIVYQLTNGVATVVGYTGNESGMKNVVIPDMVNGCPVKYIAYDAFQNCSALETIQIPDHVMHIGSSAFSGCGNLQEIIIPSGVKAISAGTFNNCSGLTRMTIPENVMSIERCAFSGCSNLEHITIPAGVTVIGAQAFQNCGKLTGVTIPEGITSIGFAAFQECSSLTDITIPKSVTTIGGCAFARCSSLTSITILEGVTSIGYAAFQECSSLADITIPKSVTTIGGCAFARCSSLTSITILEGVASIGFAAFQDCSNLTHITIPEGVTTIGDYAFSGCSSLTSVTIPEGVTIIDDCVFGSCSSLTSITIPEGVTIIDDCAFDGCSSLTDIAIPESVTYFGNRAFAGCNSLTSIAIPASVTFIDDDAFVNCTGLTSITIPEGVTCINDAVFSGCTGLTSVNIPKSVTSIGWYAFRNCSNLTSITIPESVTFIDDFAFDNCPNLKQFNVVEGSYAYTWGVENGFIQTV